MKAYFEEFVRRESPRVLNAKKAEIDPALQAILDLTKVASILADERPAAHFKEEWMVALLGAVAATTSEMTTYVKISTMAKYVPR